MVEKIKLWPNEEHSLVGDQASNEAIITEGENSCDENTWEGFTVEVSDSYLGNQKGLPEGSNVETETAGPQGKTQESMKQRIIILSWSFLPTQSGCQLVPLPLRTLVLRFMAFNGQSPSREGTVSPSLGCHISSWNAVIVLLHSSLETRLSLFSDFPHYLLQVFHEFGKLTQDFGGRRVCHEEGSLLECRISALSWPPTSSQELQTKSSLCLAGSVPPTSGLKILVSTSKGT